jgi:hypothetical protein
MKPFASLPLAMVSGIVALAPAVAGAQTSDPSSSADSSAEARAEASFRAGSDAFDHGRVDEACTDFAESMHLFPALGTLLNLALCHEKQGHAASAWREFSYAAVWASDRERREFAHQHTARLERSLARVQIESPAPSNETVAIDGEALSEERQALPVFLDPGEHAVSCAAPGMRPYAGTISVPAIAPADAIVLHLPTLEPLPRAPAPPPPPKVTPLPAHSPLRRTAGWITGGVGLVAVGVGAGFGVDALVKTGDLASCPRPCSAGAAQASEAISLAAFGTGLVALALGAWLVGPPRSSQAPASTRIALTPKWSDRAASLALVGAF